MTATAADSATKLIYGTRIRQLASPPGPRLVPSSPLIQQSLLLIITVFACLQPKPTNLRGYSTRFPDTGPLETKTPKSSSFCYTFNQWVVKTKMPLLIPQSLHIIITAFAFNGRRQNQNTRLEDSFPSSFTLSLIRRSALVQQSSVRKDLRS